MATRLEMLQWLRDVTQESIVEAPADKRAALIAQARAIEVELSEIQPDDVGVERNGLSDFQAALAARQSGANVSRRA